MSTLRANTLKPITSGNSLVLQGDSGGSGVSGPSIDSNGDVDFSQNTNAKVKLPSGGGIYESNGSTEILTETSGAVTLSNTAIDSSVTMSANQSAVKTAINASGSAPIFACRAWVRFNGSGSGDLRYGSGNVTSVTDHGTGDYTVNFTTAMEDANYAIALGVDGDSTGDNRIVCQNDGRADPAVGSVAISTAQSTSESLIDCQQITVTIFR